jgi:hypothetical protein
VAPFLHVFHPLIPDTRPDHVILPKLIIITIISLHTNHNAPHSRIFSSILLHPPAKSKYLLHHTVLKLRKSMSFLLCKKPRLIPIRNNRQHQSLEYSNLSVLRIYFSIPHSSFLYSINSFLKNVYNIQCPSLQSSVCVLTSEVPLGVVSLFLTRPTLNKQLKLKNCMALILGSK